MAYALGFIGAGNMAEAVARAAIERGVLESGQIIAADPSELRRDVFTSLGAVAVDSNAQVIEQSQQVLIAVKPQMMSEAASALASHGRSDQVVISIMAGVRAAALERSIGRPTRIVRVMPNTPMMVGCGMAGVALGPSAKPGDQALAMRLLGAGDSKAIEVSEELLDAITAVSGSGPAYVFYLAQAMQQAAEELGLSEHAALLVSQTILGSARLLAASTSTPAELRRKVTSPGGTTQAAVEHLESKGVMEAWVDAIKAAQQRSCELGE